MRTRRLGWTFSILLACAVIASCAAPPPGMVGGVDEEHVQVPSVPLPTVASLSVTAALLDRLACDECQREGGADRDRFFSGRLALASLDALIADPSDPRRSEWGGNLFVSGYFGGLQLRGTLGSLGARDAGPASPLIDLVGRSTLAGIDDLVHELSSVAAEGTESMVRARATQLLPVLALLYGYNLGYVQVALERPPTGVTNPVGRLICDTSLSCRTPGLELAGATTFASSAQRLVSPPDERWSQTAALVHAVVTASVPGGRQVWAGLLSGGGFGSAGYDAIIDLSGAFLQVAGVALAGAAEGAAGGDADVARRSLALTAGLLAWAGSYFLGLASPLNDTDLPQLRCG